MTTEQALNAVEKAIDKAFERGKELSIHSVIDMLPTDEVIEANGKEGGLQDDELQMYFEGATWLREHLRKLILSKGN